MKTLELRRHGKKEFGLFRDMLSPEGIEHARTIGREEMRPQARTQEYTHLVCSPYTRTLQSLAAFIEGAGNMAITGFRQESRIISPRINEWSQIFNEIGEDIGDLMKARPDFIREEAASLGGALKAIASEIPTEARLLLVAHSPLIEVMVLGVTGTVMAPISFHEGVVLNVDGDCFVIEREIRYT